MLQWIEIVEVTEKGQKEMGTRFYVTILSAILLCQAGCTGKIQTVEPNTPTTSGESQSANENVSQESAPFIIDVRSQEEWDAGHLEQAIFIPHEELADKIGGVTDDKSAKLVLY